MNKPMHWADIQAAIYKADSSISAIADMEGVSPAMVTQVIRGTRTSHAVAYAIAAVTSIPTERMWPGKYLKPTAYRETHNGKSRGRLRKVANG